MHSVLEAKEISSLLESVANNQMMRDLWFPQKYNPWNHFLTFTCNQKIHVGTSTINNWIDHSNLK